MRWGHLDRTEQWGGQCWGKNTRWCCWWNHIMCGEAGVSALRFHLCNLPSIVQDYYQLFNYSDDIYQGQLYRAMQRKWFECFTVALTVRRVRWWGSRRVLNLLQELLPGSVPTFSYKCCSQGSEGSSTLSAIHVHISVVFIYLVRHTKPILSLLCPHVGIRANSPEKLGF